MLKEKMVLLSYFLPTFTPICICLGILLSGISNADATTVKVKHIPLSLVKKAKWANDNSPVPNLMPLVSKYSADLKLTKGQISAFEALSKTEMAQTKNLLAQFGRDNALLREKLLQRSYSTAYANQLEHAKVNVLLDMSSILSMDIKQSGFIKANLTSTQWHKLVSLSTRSKTDR